MATYSIYDEENQKSFKELFDELASALTALLPIFEAFGNFYLDNKDKIEEHIDWD